MQKTDYTFMEIVGKLFWFDYITSLNSNMRINGEFLQRHHPELWAFITNYQDVLKEVISNLKEGIIKRGVGNDPEIIYEKLIEEFVNNPEVLKDYRQELSPVLDKELSALRGVGGHFRPNLLGLTFIALNNALESQKPLESLVS